MRISDWSSDVCSSDLVLVLNPDAVVGPTTVDDLATALAAHPHAGMVAPRLLSPDGSVQDSVRSFKTVQTLLARRTPYGSTRRGQLGSASCRERVCQYA